MVSAAREKYLEGSCRHQGKTELRREFVQISHSGWVVERVDDTDGLAPTAGIGLEGVGVTPRCRWHQLIKTSNRSRCFKGKAGERRPNGRQRGGLGQGVPIWLSRKSKPACRHKNLVGRMHTNTDILRVLGTRFGDDHSALMGPGAVLGLHGKCSAEQQ